jgi:hypothetical protein
MIRALRVGTIGTRYWGARTGHLHALLPEPVDASDGDFDRLVAGLVEVLVTRFGDPSVVAPRRAPTSPSPTSWLNRLAHAIRPTRPQDLVNPGQLAPDIALLDAARSDNHLDFALVEFGRSLGQTHAAMFSADGHPIFWLWLHEEVHGSWLEIVEVVSRDWPCSEVQLAWEGMLPARPRLSVELPRANLHRGDSASWTDGARCLNFAAGLGVDPCEVYLPPESQWIASAPAWAATLRGTIVRDFEQLGARVVAISGAHVHEAPVRT